MTETHVNLRIVTEARMPQDQGDRGAFPDTGRGRDLGLLGDVARLVIAAVAAFVVVLLYIGVPIALLAGDRLDSLLHAMLFAGAVVAVGTSVTLGVLHSTNLDIEAKDMARPSSVPPTPDILPSPRRASLLLDSGSAVGRRV